MGGPVIPLDANDKTIGDPKQVGDKKVAKKAPQGFKDEKDVKYESRKVPHYSTVEKDIDAEDIRYNFKLGKPTASSPKRTT